MRPYGTALGCVKMLLGQRCNEWVGGRNCASAQARAGCSSLNVRLVCTSEAAIVCDMVGGKYGKIHIRDELAPSELRAKAAPTSVRLYRNSIAIERTSHCFYLCVCACVCLGPAMPQDTRPRHAANILSLRITCVPTRAAAWSGPWRRWGWALKLNDGAQPTLKTDSGGSAKRAACVTQTRHVGSPKRTTLCTKTNPCVQKRSDFADRKTVRLLDWFQLNRASRRAPMWPMWLRKQGPFCQSILSSRGVIRTHFVSPLCLSNILYNWWPTIPRTHGPTKL